jgi:hypothetical protein
MFSVGIQGIACFCRAPAFHLGDVERGIQFFGRLMTGAASDFDDNFDF